MKVLIVIDQPTAARAARKGIEREGHATCVVRTASEALSVQDRWRPNVAIVDSCLTDMDGRELTTLMKRVSALPVILVSDLGAETDIVAGLAVADDYLVKPFRSPELVARIYTITRRVGGDPSGSGFFHHAGLEMDIRQHRVRVDGRPLRLTPTEFDILRMVLESDGDLVSRHEIAQAQWGRSIENSNNLIDVNMSSLRKKLGCNDRFIETVRGKGFRLAEPDDTAPAAGSAAGSRRLISATA